MSETDASIADTPPVDTARALAGTPARADDAPDGAPASLPAARALRVGALLGVAFLVGSALLWDLLLAPDHLEALLPWRAGGAVVLIAAGLSSYALPQRAMVIGAVMSAAAAVSIGAVVGALPYGLAYGIGALLLLAMTIGFVALDGRAAGISAAAALVGAGTSLWLGGSTVDAMLAIGFFFVPALAGAVLVAHTTLLRIDRNLILRRQLEALREDLQRFGRTDELTGVHDEKQLQQLARREIALARRHKSALSALKIDIVQLDEINRRHGRGTADETLRAVASMCQATLRETDLLARLGAGDEFAAVLPEADARGAQKICERLQKALERASVLAGDTVLEVNVVVGAATLAEGDQSIDDLLKRADAALKEQRASGTNGTAAAT